MGGNNGASNNPGPSTLRWGLIENNMCEQGNPSDQIYGGNPGYGIRWYEETGTTYMKNITVAQQYHRDLQFGLLASGRCHCHS